MAQAAAGAITLMEFLELPPRKRYGTVRFAVTDTVYLLNNPVGGRLFGVYADQTMAEHEVKGALGLTLEIEAQSLLVD
jgi:hypothetical protein